MTPSDNQIILLLRQRGSLRVNEIKNYFQLSGGWVKPLRDTLTALVASGTVYCDARGNWLLAFVK